MVIHVRHLAARIALVSALVMAVFGSGGVAAAAPPAPTGLSPANGASVTVPFTISWNAVSDPSGIAAYNWEVSNSSTMSPVILLNSTNGTTTQDTVSGLANGTYFWHVQAISGAFFQSAWSATQSFTVTGANANSPGVATLNPPQGATQFHPMETIQWTWSAVPGASTYIFDASNDPNFPVATKVHFDNVATNSFTLDLGDSEPQGTWYVRVQAVNANRIAGPPSNVQTFVLSFNAPLPPPPTPQSPVNGVTAALPITFHWTDVPNPQTAGYTIEIATDPGFQNIAFLNNQITGNQYTVTSLPAGTLYWRVNSMQGDSAPNTAAVTAWSQTATFVVPAVPSMASLQVTIDPASAGDGETLYVQFTGPAPAGGTVVTLSSGNQTAAPLPATFTMPAGFAFGQVFFTVGQVATATPVTLTGTLKSGNGSSASVTFNVQPPSLQSLSISSPITGGVQTSGIVQLHGVAPASGINVSLTSSSPAVKPPASVTVAAGSPSVSFNIPTNAVTTATSATITATYNGKSVTTPLTLNPQVAPASISLSPTSVSGSNGSFATVSLATPVNYDVQLPISTSNPSVTTINNFVTIPAGANGGFNIFVTPVSTTTNVTISVTGAGVTKSAVLTVQPAGAPAPSGPTLSSLTLNPSTVAATTSSQGTVSFSAAVSAATVVNLGSGNTAASVPASVTVPAGGTSASFTVTTGTVSGTTTFSITGTSGGVTVSAPLTVTQAPPGPAGVTGMTIAPSSIVGGANATGTVSLGQPAPSGGTSVTLSSNNTAASVPASVTVAAGATSANFTVRTSAVSGPQSVTITATGGGASATASMTVTPASTGGTTADTVKVTQAEYVVSDKVLNVSATSTSSNATLKAYVSSSGALIGTLSNKGGGQYEGQLSWSTNPQNITVKSSLGGSASSAVTAK
jgi:hypothetical protein